MADPKRPAQINPAMVRPRRAMLPPALQIRPTKYPNPFNGDAFAPLTDAGWIGIPAAIWNTSPVQLPAVSGASYATGGAPAVDVNLSTQLTRNASAKFTQQTLQVGSVAQSVLPEREARQYLLIQNGGGGTIYIGFSEIPSAATGIEVIVGGAYELRTPAPSNQIFVVCPTATATVRVIEG